MELKELHVHTLEFHHHNGSCTTNADLELLERRNDGFLAPVPETKLFPSAGYLYFISPDDCFYEVHFAHCIICTLSFPHQVNLVMMQVIAE